MCVGGGGGMSYLCGITRILECYFLRNFTTPERNFQDNFTSPNGSLLYMYITISVHLAKFKQSYLDAILNKS